MTQCKVKYTIQIGSWTKLPNGKVQEDTRDIIEMMAKASGTILERYLADVGDRWDYVGALNAYHGMHATIEGVPHVVIYDESSKVTTHEASLFIPYNELQKMLNTPVEAPKLQSLLNTKLDCRKPDGAVDEELSRAFQEACFEQGVKWGKFGNNCCHSDKHFLYASEEYISFSNKEGINDDFFDKHKNKQINFKYSRTLTWEATEVKPVVEDELVSICGVEYSAKELKEALDLIGKVKK